MMPLNAAVRADSKNSSMQVRVEDITRRRSLLRRVEVSLSIPRRGVGRFAVREFQTTSVEDHGVPWQKKITFVFRG